MGALSSWRGLFPQSVMAGTLEEYVNDPTHIVPILDIHQKTGFHMASYPGILPMVRHRP